MIPVGEIRPSRRWIGLPAGEGPALSLGPAGREFANRIGGADTRAPGAIRPSAAAPEAGQAGTGSPTPSAANTVPAASGMKAQAASAATCTRLTPVRNTTAARSRSVRIAVQGACLAR